MLRTNCNYGKIGHAADAIVPISPTTRKLLIGAIRITSALLRALRPEPGAHGMRFDESRVSLWLSAALALELRNSQPQSVLRFCVFGGQRFAAEIRVA